MTQDFIVSPDVVSRELEKEQVLLDMTNGAYFGLNEAGSLIWKLFLENKNADQIAEKLVLEYQVTQEEAMKDITILFKTMQEKGLIKSRAD